MQQYMPQFVRAHNAGLMLGKAIMQHNSLSVFVAVTIAAHTPQRKVQYYNTKLIADVKGVVRPEPLDGLLRKFLDIHKYHLTFRVAPQEWLSRHAMTPRTRAAFRRRAVLRRTSAARPVRRAWPYPSGLLLHPARRPSGRRAFLRFRASNLRTH